MKQAILPIKILTITGQSGAGKGSIFAKLQELRPGIDLVISLTTRKPRPTDMPGECRTNVAREEFEKRQRMGDFLWVASVYGDLYGTLKESVDLAIAAPETPLPIPQVMTLVPGVVKTLRNYAEGRCGVLSYYVIAPSPEELMRRLKFRGENEETIAKRMAANAAWDEDAKNSGIPYIFLENKERDAGIEKAAREILKHIRGK